MKTIDGYAILGLLGRGGMGAVYKVGMPVTGKILALKLLDPNPFLTALAGQEQITRQFLAEAATLAQLSHPNIASIWGYGTHQGRPYFLMEYFCRDLGQIIGETGVAEDPTRRLPLPRAASYALQTLQGLARLHHAGVVHRDIKPFNLLVTNEDQVRITDFGLSRARGESLSGPPGLKVGSPYYAAPEQERDPDLAGPQADLYSAAATLYRMLFGILPVWPLAGDTLPSALSKDMDPAWDRFFTRCLSPRPADRPLRAADMAGELTTLVSAWRKRLVRACRLDETGRRPGPEVQVGQAGRRRPRSRPQKAFGQQARQAFGLDGLFRPAAYGAPRLTIAGEQVFDAATGLVWQQGGSPYALNMAEAVDYIDDINARAEGGASGWRLPTVDELATILSPQREFTDHCLPDVFDPALRLIWSADRRTFTQHWFADAEQGAMCWADDTCRRDVRAVRSQAG